VGSGWQTILRSKNIYGPYEKKVVLERGSTSINGPHQGSIVDTPDGKWAFFHFQHDGSLGRVLHLQPMHWQDGWPVIGVDIDRNGIGEPVYVWKKPIESDKIVVPETDDEFSSGKLSLQWQFNHNPVDDAWSLTSPRGSLTLQALVAPEFRLARNTITQKVMGYVSEVTVAVDLSGMAEGQRCGLVCMGKENQMLGVKKVEGKLGLYQSDDTTETELAPITKKRIYLRVSIDIPNKEFRFAYSLDNLHFVSCGEPFFIHFGNWKGARVGLYCYNKQEKAGRVSFPWFHYKHDGPQTMK
jgi:xylan 1,4-beta-xylosidase